MAKMSPSNLSNKAIGILKNQLAKSKLPREVWAFFIVNLKLQDKPL
jgi:hypothetical protein